MWRRSFCPDSTAREVAVFDTAPRYAQTVPASTEYAEKRLKRLRVKRIALRTTSKPSLWVPSEERAESNRATSGGTGM